MIILFLHLYDVFTFECTIYNLDLMCRKYNEIQKIYHKEHIKVTCVNLISLQELHPYMV